MRVSLNWLKELLPAEAIERQPLRDLAYTLDMTGTAVEAIHTTGEGLEGVLIGQVVEKVKHPDADKLWVTKVDIGGDEPLQIVCGAQNFEQGDKIPVAVVGATEPGCSASVWLAYSDSCSHGLYTRPNVGIQRLWV